MSLAIVSNIFSSGLADFSGPFCVRLTKALAHFGWQGCVIAAVYYFVDLGLRNKGANTRYIAGLVAMAFLAICPPVTFILLSPANSTIITKLEDFHQLSSSQNQFASDEVSPWLRPNPDRSDSKSVHPQVKPFLRRAAIQSWRESIVINQLIERVSPYVMTVYLLVSLVLLCRMLVGYSVGRKLKADSIDIANNRLQQFVEHLCEQWSMTVVPVVASCKQVTTPVVFGVLRPIILLPPCLLTGLNVEQLEALLAHELAHIRRWDLLVNLAQRIIEALLFYHPAVWYVSHRISIQREHACDDLVISTGWRPLDYCRALIGLAEACAMPRQPLMTASISISAFGRGPSEFRQRILRLAGESAESKPQMTRTGFSGLASVIVMLTLVSIVLSSRSGSKTETPKKIESVVVAQPEVIVEENPQVKEANSDAAGQSNFVLNAPLVDVVIEGNSTIPNSEIAKHIKTRPGRPVTQKQIKDDVDALVRTRWFSTVEPTFRRTNEDVVLVFLVLERPIVRRVEYKGLKKIKQKVFDAMTQLEPGSPFDVASNRECARRIEEHYHEKGFAFATVELEKGNNRDDREVVFLVSEGPKVRVSSVEFNKSRDLDNSIPGNNTRKKIGFIPFFSGEFDQSTINDDIECIKRYYHSLGYFDFDIKHLLKFTEDKSKVEIYYEIEEGTRYKIRNIEVAGNTVLSVEEIRKLIKVAEGIPYNQRDIDKDVDAIATRYLELGRLFCRVDAMPRLTEAEGFVDVVYKIDEDKVYRVRGMNLHIPADHSDTSVNKRARKINKKIQPGDLADPKTVHMVERRLEGSQNFESSKDNGVRSLSFLSGNYDQNAIKDDIEGIKQYYHTLGYFDVNIKHGLRLSEDPSKSEIRYEINEGIRYKIRHVEIIGNRIVPESEIRNVLKVTDGEFYNASEIDRDIDAIKSVFDQRGHLLAHIEPVPRWSEEPGVIDLVYQISPCIEVEDSISRDYLW